MNKIVLSSHKQFSNFLSNVLLEVWIRVKYHVKDHKTILDKKRLIAFWLERYAKRENGKPITVMFDLSETGINSIVSTF